jgi:hypothetical protein
MAHQARDLLGLVASVWSLPADHLDHRVLIYGTQYRLVSVAKASETGHATNVIQGLAVSMEATALPVIVISAGIPILLCGRFLRHRYCSLTTRWHLPVWSWHRLRSCYTSIMPAALLKWRSAGGSP